MLSPQESQVASIMAVDDNPANLKLLEDMLREHGYEVRSFPRGRHALAAAERNPPDLILLDINMPEMSGYEVCERLKADARLREIPVIFLSALNDAADKVKALKTGGVDYISKPFHFEEVRARVETHLALQRARRAERELLEKTLSGAVRTLSDLLHLAGSALPARSNAIRSIALHIACRMQVVDLWQYDIAATLCLIGCMALPPDVFERAYARQASPAEEEMFRACPETGARLLANIPRLETVAEMIRRQQTPIEHVRLLDACETGGAALRIAVELDRWMFGGLALEAGLNRMRALPHEFPQNLLRTLEDYSPPVEAVERMALPVRELRVGMTTEEDIVTRDGNWLIAAKGTQLNSTTVERLRNFHATRGIREPVHVLVSQSDAGAGHHPAPVEGSR